MKRGLSDVVNFLRGTTQIEKIYRGITLIWENWVLKTGNLVIMTANNAPSPFTCSSTVDSADAYLSFDQTDFEGDRTSTSAITYQLNFGQTLQVIKFDGRFRTAGGSNYQLTVELLKDGTTWTEVFSTTWNDPYNMDVTLSGDDVFESTAIRLTIPYNNPGVIRQMTMFKIKEWFERIGS
jgi:hypothetical protein